MRTTERDFIHSFRETQPKFSRLYSCLLARESLTLPQYALLSELAAADGPLAMTEVSRRLYITKPAVTSLVDKLEKKRYIRRLAHPTDRRIQLLKIQSQGLKAVKETQNTLLRILLRGFTKVSPAGQKMIIKFYKDISSSMDAVMKGASQCR